MSTPTLGPRDARTLVLGGSIILVTLLAARTAPAAVALLRQRQARADSVVQTATNAEARLRLARTAQQALAEVRSRLTSYDSAFVEGTTASAASASLAELVADAATDAEAQLGPMQLMADTVVGTARVGRVSTRVHVSGDLMSIALFVQMLEEGPQLTAVREMSISPAQPALSRGQPERLQAELLVEGVFLAPGGKSRP